MLLHDRAKYLGLIFSIAFSAFLISHQASIFASLMARTTSQIIDVLDAQVWVMDPETQSFDEIKPLSENALFRLRSIPDVEWAVRLFKQNARAKNAEGSFRSVILLGLDDATLVGAPKKMILGSVESLREPDAVILDLAGYNYLFPGQPVELGRVLEINDRRAKVVGICEASAPFQTLPVVFARYSLARTFVGPERNQMSFVLADPKAGVSPAALAREIEKITGLLALTRSEFAWKTIFYYIRNTGIPVNFGITVIVAIIVGTVVSGQTFYLFTVENLRQFAALKAIGVSNDRLVRMVLLQAAMVGFIGFALGVAMSAVFFLATKDVSHLRGFILRWQVLSGTSVLVLMIVCAASLMSVRKLLKLEPAMVFRS
jgi:putative ABC transport system permease protein